MLIVSGLQLFAAGGVIVYTLSDENPTARNIVVGLEFGLGMAFALLAFVGRRRPLGACLTGLALFFASQIAMVFWVPGTVMRGFIIKLVTLVMLMRMVLTSLEERSRP